MDMNLEKFTRMSTIEQLFYVTYHEDGEAYRKHLDLASITGSEWAACITDEAKWIKDCPFEKFTAKDWAYVLASYPNLQSKFLEHLSWADLDGSNWAEIVGEQSEFAEFCDWDKLEFQDWNTLYSSTDEFYEKCPFGKFNPEEIDALLRRNPGLTPYSGIIDPQLVYIINKQPITSWEDDDIPFYPAFSETPESMQLCHSLQSIIGYKRFEAKNMTTRIQCSNSTIIAVYAKSCAAHHLEQLNNALQNIYPPLKCVLKPFAEAEEFSD